MYKIVFLDIDGTILDSNDQMDGQLKETVKKVQENGVKVVLASGRSLDASIKYGEMLGCSNYVVYNGGYVVSNNKVIYEAKIPAMLAFEICYKTKDAKGTYIHFSDRTSRSNNPQPDVEHLLPVAALSNVTDTEMDAHRLALYIDDNKQRAKILEEINGQYVFEEGNRIEVYASGSKWSGIMALINHLGISPTEVVAIGNGINDVEMLESAGIGIAMGNSPDFVRERADMITEDNDHHGVTLALTKVFQL